MYISKRRNISLKKTFGDISQVHQLRLSQCYKGASSDEFSDHRRELYWLYTRRKRYSHKVHTLGTVQFEQVASKKKKTLYFK